MQSAEPIKPTHNSGDDRTLPGALVQTQMMRKLPLPCCCVTTGSFEVQASPEALAISNNSALCNTSIKQGGGYNVLSTSHTKVGAWSSAYRGFLCSKKMQVSFAMANGGGGSGPIPGKDGKEQMSRIRSLIGQAKGFSKGYVPDDKAATKDFVTNTCLCLMTNTLSVHPEGEVVLSTKTNSGCATEETADGAYIEDMSFARYTKANFCTRLCCGARNAIDVGFGNGAGNMEFKGSGDSMTGAHAALMETFKSGGASEVMASFKSNTGSAIMTPGLVTVTNVENKCFGLFSTEEVISFPAKKVAYIRAGLPSWQSAFMTAIRDIEVAALFGYFRKMFTTDIVKLMSGNFIPFFNSMYLLIILYIKACLSVVAFLRVFFCRKTAVLFGGPGNGGVVKFQPSEAPEKFLAEIGAAITASANVGGSKNMDKASGAAKTAALPVQMPDSVPITIATPMMMQYPVAQPAPGVVLVPVTAAAPAAMAAPAPSTV